MSDPRQLCAVDVRFHLVADRSLYAAGMSGNTENLSDQIARDLKASLIAGQMVPGVTYSVPALAEEFGVSAMPVREAVLSLVQQGLMTAIPNKGFRVVEFTDKDLDDIMQLRLMLEVPAVVAAAPAVTDKLMAELHKVAKEIARAAKAGQLTAYLEADRQFHLTLTSLVHNPRLNELIDDLRSRSRLTGLGRLVERGSLSESAAEHLQMLDAIAAGDTDALASLMDRHIRHSRGIWAGRAEQD